MPMMRYIIKAIIILFLGLIFFSLGNALYFLLHDKSQSTRQVKALTWRIGLSVVLFVILLVAYALGWISPHSVGG
jgi:putative copper export protein